MKFYVVCPNTSRKIYLSLAVESRSQIDDLFTVKCPHDEETHQYSRKEVRAEPTLGASIGGAIAGGLIGTIVAGPLGAILGGGLGIIAGSNTEKEELQKARRFNEG